MARVRWIGFASRRSSVDKFATANPEQFAAYIQSSLELFGSAVKAANLQPE